MEYIKPLWKAQAEKDMTSLPGYYHMREIERYLMLGNGYAAKLARKYHLQTWKIGQVRLMKEQDFQWLVENYEKR